MAGKPNQGAAAPSAAPTAPPPITGGGIGSSPARRAATEERVVCTIPCGSLLNGVRFAIVSEEPFEMCSESLAKLAEPLREQIDRFLKIDGFRLETVPVEVGADVDAKIAAAIAADTGRGSGSGSGVPRADYEAQQHINQEQAKEIYALRDRVAQLEKEHDTNGAPELEAQLQRMRDRLATLETDKADLQRALAASDAVKRENVELKQINEALAKELQAAKSGPTSTEVPSTEVPAATVAS